MKTLIFIVLKIVELAAVPFVYLGLCYGGYYFNGILPESNLDLNNFGVDFYFIAPCLSIVMLLVLILVMMLIWGIITVIPDWINKNKEWSNKIYNKLKK